MNKHEILKNTVCASIDRQKRIKQYEWSETKVENRIEIETGKTIGSENTQQLHSWTWKQKLNSGLKTNSRLWQGPCPYKIPLFSLKKL